MAAGPAEMALPGIKSDTHEITSAVTTGVPDAAGNLYRVRALGDNQRYGYVDGHGKVVIPLQFNLAWDFDETGLAVVESEGGGSCVINRHGQVVLRNECGGVISLGRGRFGLKTKEGMIRFVGLTEPFQPDIQCMNVWGAFAEGLIGVQIKGKWGFMDETGKLVIPANFDFIESFKEGLAPACLGDKKFGYIDHGGRWVIPPQFGMAQSFQEGMARVEADNLWHFIDHRGQQAISIRYGAMPMDFSEGLACVKDPGTKLYGYIDKSGQYKIPPKFHEMGGIFSEGLAAVKLESENKSGYINHEGEFVIQVPKSEGNLYQFRNGHAWVELKGRHGLLNKSGAWVWAEIK